MNKENKGGILAQLDFGDNRVHFGGYDDRLSIEGALPHLLADTLFSALCHGWKMLYGEGSLEQLLQSFLSKNPPWRMSDGFPYLIEKQSHTTFLPKPAGTLIDNKNKNENHPGDSSTSARKKRLKKIAFLQAEDIVPFLYGELDPGIFEDDSYSPLWRESIAPHVAVGRISEEKPNPYHVNYLQFLQDDMKKSGLWVLFDIAAPEYLPQLKEVMAMLGETTGIGGKKSTGAGRFTVTWSDEKESHDALKLLEDLQKNSKLTFQPQAEENQLLLSIANPADFERSKLKQEGTARYQLVNRRGFHYSTHSDWPGLIKKKPVAMLLAGSVVKGGLKGRLVNVTPVLKDGRKAPHSLYRYGFGLSLGVPQHVS